ncbi:DUF3502 domain-containing protein [Paenibacillus roseipurpureus]|uniref:DUF3502 domain-containing protein n=1 Tax=Paenibacillus roseopurpureus TaxID=2918901 RepID=A0AA96LKU6_9BACL|nr:DUF3502 domain-containing protein [Paenibacillus sp. MBLB1832]WNR42893.1 DUF3502 domain-containing protein [Paenibacillus sp. MBLB1832]
MKMMSNTVKFYTAALLTATLLLSGCSAKNDGGGSKATTPAAPSTQSAGGDKLDISKEQKLSIYLVGDPQPDAGLVYDEVNKKLKKDLNATLDVKYIPWTDMQNKYNLVFAAGEDFDGIYTGSWTGYTEQVTKGGFKEITEDMLKKYAPDYYKQLMEKYPNALNETKINGKSYMLPAFDVWADSTLVTVRGDLREKYNLPPVKTIDDFDNYLITVAKNDKNIIALNSTGQDMFEEYMNLAYYVPNNVIPVSKSMPYLVYKLDDKKGKVLNVLDDPAYKAVLERVKKLDEAGVLPKSVLTNKTPMRDLWKSGKTAAVVGNAAVANGRQNEGDTDHPEWKAETVDLWPNAIKVVGPGNGSGFAIHSTSKNWERLLMMYNAFITNRDYQDLTEMGIKDKHYTVQDGVYVKGPDGDKFPFSSNCPWGWQNKDMMLKPTKGTWVRMDYDQKWRKDNKAISPLLNAMNFNDADVKNEMSAFNNSIQTRGYILATGKYTNLDGDIATLKNELNKAGLEKVMTTMQKQVDEFLKNR